MFGHRSDGRLIKSTDAFFKVVPYIMGRRTDAHVFFENTFSTETMDSYIKEKRAECPSITHMSIFIAAIGRIIAEFPQLNRFIISRRIYARNRISVCFTILNEFSGDNPEETVGKAFIEEGDNVFTVSEKIEKITLDAHAEADTSIDGFLKALSKVPTCVLGFCVRFLLWLDGRGVLPKSILEFSPFHASAYLTNLGSLGIKSVYHHIYDKGNVSMFMAMGRRENAATFSKDGIEKIERSMTCKITVDERITSGFVFSRAFKSLNKYLNNPSLLEEPIKIKQDIK